MPAAAAAKSLQSCPTLCDPTDGSPPGSPVPGILQARTLEWVAISFSKAWKWKVKVKSLSHVRLLATPWTAAYQAPPSMGFSRQNTGVGCHCLLHLNPEMDLKVTMVKRKRNSSSKHALNLLYSKHVTYFLLSLQHKKNFHLFCNLMVLFKCIHMVLFLKQKWKQSS